MKFKKLFFHLKHELTINVTFTRIYNSFELTVSPSESVSF